MEKLELALEQLVSELESHEITAFSVYCSNEFDDITHVYGSDIGDDVAERYFYLSFDESGAKIISSPMGLTEALNFKSRLIIKIGIDDDIACLVILSSSSISVFDTEIKLKIIDKIKKIPFTGFEDDTSAEVNSEIKKEFQPPKPKIENAMQSSPKKAAVSKKSTLNVGDEIARHKKQMQKKADKQKRNKKKLSATPIIIAFVAVAGVAYYFLFQHDNSTAIIANADVTETTESVTKIATTAVTTHAHETTTATAIATTAPPQNTAVSTTIFIVENTTTARTDAPIISTTTATAAIARTRVTTTVAIMENPTEIPQTAPPTEPPKATTAPPQTQPHEPPKTTAPPRTTAAPPATTTAPPRTTAAPVTTTQPPATTALPATTATPVTISVPTGLKATSDGIAWNVISDADGYEVSRSTTMVGGYSVVNSIAVREGGTVSISDNSTHTGVTYFYSVRAFRVVDGVTYWSNHSDVLRAER